MYVLNKLIQIPIMVNEEDMSGVKGMSSEEFDERKCPSRKFIEEESLCGLMRSIWIKNNL